jgi:hypothetical protein
VEDVLKNLEGFYTCKLLQSKPDDWPNTIRALIKTVTPEAFILIGVDQRFMRKPEWQKPLIVSFYSDPEYPDLATLSVFNIIPKGEVSFVVNDDTACGGSRSVRLQCRELEIVF